MKNNKTLITILTFCMLSNCVLAQIAGNAIYNNPYVTSPQKVYTNVNMPAENQIYLQAEVMINVKATSYVAIFSATQNGTSAAETDSLMNIRLKNINTIMKKVGVIENEIYIDVISLVPTYSLKLEEKKFTKTANEIPTGFELKKNIHIIFYDSNKLSEVVAQMAKAEIYDIVKVDYNLANMQSTYDTLRKAAADIIKMKEKEYPKMGLHLSIENMADGFNVAYPLERYASYTAFNTGSSIEEINVAKKKKEQAKNLIVIGKNPIVNITTNKDDNADTEFIVKRLEKNKTIYYNKIPFNQFDLVINADFVEPRIQFFYTLKIKYTVTNQEKYLEELKIKAKITRS